MALVTFTEGGGGGTALSDQQGYGTLAARPAAAASNQYYFYYATDNTTLYHSDGSSWIAMSSGAGDMAAATYDPATIAEQLVGLTATQTLTNKTLTQPTVTLKQGAAPTPTAEGDIQWDTDDDTIKVGDGVGQAVFPNQVDISAEIDGDISTHAALTTTHGISAFGATLVDDADAPTARTTLGVDAAGTDNSTDVTLAGTPDYITIAGQVITRNQVDLTADVTGVLPEANLPDASATAQGVVEIATAAEVDTGTDDTRALSPLALAGSALQTKVDGIEAAADVTDATNVSSAGAVMADGTGNDITGDVVFTEKADHSSTPGAGKGYLWVKNTAPSTIIFTDDTGVDTDLGASGGIASVWHDTTPQLGGQLDVNGNALGDGTLELLAFTETGSAVNHVNITNAATGNGPTISAVGDDTNVDLVLAGKGSGVPKIGANAIATTATLLSAFGAPTSDVDFNGTKILNLDGAEFVIQSSSGTTFTPDTSTGCVFKHTMGAGNLTANAPTNEDGTDLDWFILFLIQDGTGSRTATWNAAYIPEGGAAPTLSTGANDVDILHFYTIDGGTEWFYYLAGSFAS